ncbi:MAG: Wzz/FepE/Etk N-terminal domain-containing protein [Planctomycetota bacterium]
MFIIPIIRSRYIVLVMLLVGVVGGVFAALIKPNVYVSTGKILVQVGEREASTPDNALENNGGGGGAFTLQTEISILSSQEILEKVAKALGPAELLKPYDPASLDTPHTPAPTRSMHRFQSWWFKRFNAAATDHPESCLCELCVEEATRMLLANVTIGEEMHANTVAISCGATSPELARKIASVFLDVAREHHIQLFSTDQSVETLSRLLHKANADAEQAAKKFDEFRKKNEIFDLTTQKTKLLEQIEAQDKLVRENRARLLVLDEQGRNLRERLGKEPRTEKQTIDGDWVANPDRAGVQQSIAALEAKKIELAETEAETNEHRQKMEEMYNKQIDKLREQLKAMPALIRLPAAEKELPNPRFEQLTKDLDATIKEQAQLKGPTDLAEEQVKPWRERLHKLLDATGEYESLEADARQLRSQANTIEESYHKALRMSELDKAKLSNLKVSTPPELPLDKSEPKRSKIVGIGVALGLFAGIGIAILRQMLDRTIRRPQDIQRHLGVRVIGVVPEIRRWRGARSLARHNGRS